MVFFIQKGRKAMGISEFLLTVGVPAHIVGYDFLLCAVEASQQEPDLLHHIMKRLYPYVAEKCGTTPSRVERGIRHAITIICDKNRLLMVNALIGCDVFAAHDKPANGEFIALLAKRFDQKGRLK